MPERRRGFGGRINQARDVKCVRKSTFAGVSLPGLKPHALRPRAPRQTCYQSLYCFSFLVAGSSQGFRRGMTGAWPGSPTSVLPGALLACVSGPSGVFILQIPVHTTSLHLPTDLCVTPFGFLYLSVEFRPTAPFYEWPSPWPSCSHSAPRSPCRAPSSVAGGCRDHQWPPSCCHTPMLLRSLPSVGVQ